MRKVSFEDWNTVVPCDVLDVERTGEASFTGLVNQLNVAGAIYGGQVLAQALAAACVTVGNGRPPISLHAYFLRPGDGDKVVHYEIDALLDGRSFAIRHVRAHQGDKPILYLTASFHTGEEGFDHQRQPPPTRSPQELTDLVDMVRADPERFPPFYQTRYAEGGGVEMRPTDVRDLVQPAASPVRSVWLRAKAPSEGSRAMQNQLLAYLSDMVLNGVAMVPHTVPYPSATMQVSSLDHAIWFHRPFKMDDWLLYDTTSPSAQDGRGLSLGYFYDSAGSLVATVVQEALFRTLG